MGIYVMRDSDAHENSLLPCCGGSNIGSELRITHHALRITFTAASLLILVVLALRAQFSAGGKISGFRLPEFYESAPGQTNRALKTLITGAEAEPRAAGLWAVDQMAIQTREEDGRTNLIAKAPQCEVDLNRRIVWSTGRLEVTTADGRFFTEGNEGFFCRLTNVSLTISNRVRTIIRRDLVAQPNETKSR